MSAGVRSANDDGCFSGRNNWYPNGVGVGKWSNWTIHHTVVRTGFDLLSIVPDSSIKEDLLLMLIV
jgi:hypothetical protein